MNAPPALHAYTPLNPLDLHALVLTARVDELREVCTENHPAAVAEVLQSLAQDEAWKILQTVSPGLRADIFSHFDEHYQTELALTLDRSAAVRLLTDMPPDDRAALFKRLPEERRAGILPALAHAEREDIRRLASYEEGTVGAVMTSDYAVLGEALTAAQAIDSLRTAAPDRETIYEAYVVDANRRLLGFLSLKDLILASPSRPIAKIMQHDVITASVDEDQEDAARRLQKYDMIALPVIDASRALVGILTHDDAFDILAQEQQEDLEKFAAITGSHAAGMYLKKSPWQHFCNRVLWVVGLAVIGLVSGQIIQHHEGILLQYPILIMFLPLLAAAGGNTGSQSITLVIRALALGEIDVSLRDAILVVWKELRVAFLLAAVLGCVAYGRIWVQGAISDEVFSPRIGLAVALAMGIQVVSSMVLGALLPLCSARFKLDPAVVASPALTTAVDVTGLLIYFGVVSLLLGV